MHANPIKVISFDLDDTLWAVEPVLEKAEAVVHQWLEEHCPAVTQTFDLNALKALRLKLFHQRPDLQHQISLLRILSMQQAIEASGYNSKEAEKLAHQAFDLFLHHRHEVELFDAVEETLAELQKHYQLVVITNGNAHVERLEIGQYFEFAISAEQLNSGKPSPLPFQAVLNRCDIRANQLIHVGDHHEHDIIGAKNLGIRTVWVNLDQRAWLGLADTNLANEEIRHYHELIPAIRRIELAANS